MIWNEDGFDEDQSIQDDPMDEAYAHMHDAPVGECSLCDEYVFDFDQWNEKRRICAMCEGEERLEKLRDAQSERRYAESIESWVERCNDILTEYGENRDMAYCSRCQCPRVHQHLRRQDPDAPPFSTEYVCLKCEEDCYR